MTDHDQGLADPEFDAVFGRIRERSGHRLEVSRQPYGAER